MSEEKQDAYLFIGGVMDGNYLAVPDYAQRWNIPILGFVPLGYHKDVPEDFGFNEISEAQYFRVRIGHHCNEPKNLYVFVDHSIMYRTINNKVVNTNPNMMWEIMCKLVNNYKVIK